jgi:hypothetical protein
MHAMRDRPCGRSGARLATPPLPRPGRAGARTPAAAEIFGNVRACLLATGSASSSLRCGARLFHRRRRRLGSLCAHSAPLFANHRCTRLGADRAGSMDRTGMHVRRQSR